MRSIWQPFQARQGRVLTLSFLRHCASSSNKSRPAWLEAVFTDKRTYFSDSEVDSGINKFFLSDAKAVENQRFFNFDFTNGVSLSTSFPALRQSCRCPSCFAFDAQQRRVHILDSHRADEHPSRFSFDKAKQLIHVDWASDGHKSTFSGPWLYATFRPHPLFEKIKRKAWRVKDLKAGLPQTHDYVQVTSPDHAGAVALSKCLSDIAVYGLVRIVNGPAETGALEKFTGILNYMKRTHYGVLFQVENKPTVTNIAYGSSKLTQHTDLPYFEYIPGLQFLYCVRQSQRGGESSFADGLAAAEELKRSKPLAFELLSTTPIYMYNYTTDQSDGFLCRFVPVIQLDREGDIKRIVFSNPTFDTLRHLGPEKQIAYLTALQDYMKLMETPEFRLCFKLQPGEMAIFDNTRMTHGRESFDSTEARLLEGCYMDWDEVSSRLRLLRSHLFRRRLEQWWMGQEKQQPMRTNARDDLDLWFEVDCRGCRGKQ